jgi:hypothetical protein
VITAQRQDVHRAANERSTVLTDEEAKVILHRPHQQYDPQYGIDWRKLTETIDDSGLGRRISRNKLNRFIHLNVVTVQVVVEKIRRKCLHTPALIACRFFRCLPASKLAKG